MILLFLRSLVIKKMKKSSNSDVNYMDINKDLIFFNINNSTDTKDHDLISDIQTLKINEQIFDKIDNYLLTLSTDTKQKHIQINKSTSTEEEVIPQNIATSLEPNDLNALKLMLENEDYENGIVNPSEIYFRKLFLKNKIETMNGLVKIFMDNYSSDRRKINNLVGILHLLSHAKYNEVEPIGQLLAISAITHKNREVAEFGIKCFENWEHPDGIEKLKAVRFSTQWLQDYAEEVINELRGIC